MIASLLQEWDLDPRAGIDRRIDCKRNGRPSSQTGVNFRKIWPRNWVGCGGCSTLANIWGKTRERILEKLKSSLRSRDRKARSDGGEFPSENKKGHNHNEEGIDTNNRETNKKKGG